MAGEGCTVTLGLSCWPKVLSRVKCNIHCRAGEGGAASKGRPGAHTIFLKFHNLKNQNCALFKLKLY
jgi:hypothetical protein